MSETTNTHRCSRCDLNWPKLKRYETCPKCGDKTWETYGSGRLTQQQASEMADKLVESRRLHAEFEKFYAEREARRDAAIKEIEHLDFDLVKQGDKE